MSTVFQLLLHYLTQLASLFWAPFDRQSFAVMENLPPNSPTSNAQADGAGSRSPNQPQSSNEASAASPFDGT